MSESKRVTAHRGRGTADRRYNPKHNDRDFGEGIGDGHIDREKSEDNKLWHRYQKRNPDMTFDEAERQFYEQTFGAGLESRNARYTKSGHKDRCQTIDDYRKNLRSCPEEVIFQIGTKDNTIDGKSLWRVCVEYINWHQKQYPQAPILNLALHLDEATPHLHARQVWLAHDKDGNAVVSQAAALAEMGIERPDPSKPVGRFNNAKMTYTRECRERLCEICRQHGIDIETEPKEPSESGKSLLEYQTAQEAAKLAATERELAALQSELAEQGATLASVLTTLEDGRASRIAVTIASKLQQENPHEYARLRIEALDEIHRTDSMLLRFATPEKKEKDKGIDR